MMEVSFGSQGSSQWKLPEKLIALSEGDRYPQVLEEWRVGEVTILEDDEELERCLCNHYPIREVCQIVNTENGKTAIVGNCCVKKFEREFEGETAFKGSHKVFAALKRIQNDINASANEELIQYAFEKDIFDEADQKFYLDIWRKRSLSERQLTWKTRLNKRIIKEMNPTAHAQMTQAVAKRRLTPTYQPATPAPQPVRDPLADLRLTPTKIASPTLVRRAFEQNVIRQRDFDFISSIHQRGVKTPSDKQQSWINDINGRILSKMGGATP